MTAACDERRRLAADRGTRKKIQVIPYSLDLRILWGARRRRLASMVFYCRTARGAAAAFAPQGSFLSLANTRPALREGLVYELPQHTLVLARLPSVAHILKKSRVFFAPSPRGRTVDPRDRMSVIGVTHVQRWFYNSLGETTHLFGWLPDNPGGALVE